MDTLQDIAVGILQDAHSRVLIAQRRPGTLGAGQWEFPGGKHEPGETLQATLTRELQEELGITPRVQTRLIRMTNELATRTVRLHVWRVSDWQGQPRGREGQRLVWCHEAELSSYDLLPGNRPIINALRLPDRFSITPDVVSGQGWQSWLESLQATLDSGIKLLRFRAPGLDDTAYAKRAVDVIAHARDSGAMVLLDRSPAMVTALGADGLHWSAAQAESADSRPVSDAHWFGVSVHDEAELQAAAGLNADFAVLSPVQVTASHPQRQPLGWSGWRRLRGDRGLPVYALGGLSAHELETAQAHNAQGIAAIRAFWGAANRP